MITKPINQSERQFWVYVHDSNLRSDYFFSVVAKSVEDACDRVRDMELLKAHETIVKVTK